MTGSHNSKLSSFDLITKEIIIENEVWICAKSIVLQGVICGKGSLLSAGSVATRNLDPNSVYMGNPAVKIRDRI